MFTNLSKAFHKEAHTILLKKLELYGIRDNNRIWIKIYLSNRKPCIKIDPTTKTNLKQLKCGVPQRSIFAFLLFLLYVNNLKNTSSLLDPVMFADDTNLFYTHRNIHCPFSDVNKEMTNIKEWFASNKLSLNVKKAKYSFFHKRSKKDNISLQLPNLTINNHKINQEKSIKFLGVLSDEN